MIERLFPPGVVTVTATPEMWEAPLHPQEEAFVRGAVAKRRREFAAGRACARRALAALGIHDFPLLVQPDRTPRWPPGVVGSLTHSHGFCGVAVARGNGIAGLGVDVELRSALDPATLEMICSPAEIERLRGLPAEELLARAKVLFCAKEAAYKCYFPLTATFLGFHDMEIDLDAEVTGFGARILRDVLPFGSVRTLRGKVARDERYVYAGVTLSRAVG